MDELAQTLGMILGAIGGLEFIKWIYHRKIGKKQQEIEAKKEEFHYLRERIDFLNQDIIAKEQRFTEQTLHVRDLNRQLLDMEVELGNKKAKISALEAERSMKLCERKGCGQRQPQSGY